MYHKNGNKAKIRRTNLKERRGYNGKFKFKRIMADNRDLHKQVDSIKAEYKEKEDNLEWKYDYKIKTLEKENNYLQNVIDKFRETIHKFIEWICVNFDMGTGDTLINVIKM